MKTTGDIVEHLLLTVHHRLVSHPLAQDLQKAVDEILNDWPSRPEKKVQPNAVIRLPAVSHIDTALKAGEIAGDREICTMIRTLLPVLSWFFGYKKHPDFPHLEDKIAFTQFVGPEDLWQSPRLAIGLTLVAPETLYPAHCHPATEIYLPLAGTGLWSMGNADYHPRSPGELIVHQSNVPHTTLAQKDPILALYIWHGDIRSPSVWQNQ